MGIGIGGQGLSWVITLISMPWAEPTACSQWCCCAAPDYRRPPQRIAEYSLQCDDEATPRRCVRWHVARGENVRIGVSFANVVGISIVETFTCSSSSEDSSSLNSMITSLPSSSSWVLVFFFLGLGGSGGSCHIMGCQQREPSNGVGVKSTKRYNQICFCQVSM